MRIKFPFRISIISPIAGVANHEPPAYMQPDRVLICSLDAHMGRKRKMDNQSVSKNELDSVLQNLAAGSVVDLPIFTEDFLEHNKLCEEKLRMLRSAVLDQEVCNKNRSGYIEQLNAAYDRAQQRLTAEQAVSGRLANILEQLETAMLDQLACFECRRVPRQMLRRQSAHIGDHCCGPPTRQNLDRYMETVALVMNGSTPKATFGKRVRMAIEQLDQMEI